MIQTHCVICGDKEEIIELYPANFAQSDLNHATYSARRLPDHIHYRIVKCARCGMVFSSPILPIKKIAKLYRQSVCSYDDQVRYITSTYLKLFDVVRPSLPQNPKILEVGCGNGFFLKALYDTGLKNVWGVEPGVEMVRKAQNEIRRNIKNDIFRAKQFPKHSFDVVCCFHTLDHMPDPIAFVEEAYAVLKPGGFVIVVVHDSQGLSVKLFGEKSPIFDIEHIYLFSKSTLSQICESYHFQTVSANSLINTYPLSYWVRMSGVPQRVKRFGIKTVEKTGIGKLNISLAGGNIYYIGRKLPLLGKEIIYQ